MTDAATTEAANATKEPVMVPDAEPPRRFVTSHTGVFELGPENGTMGLIGRCVAQLW